MHAGQGVEAVAGPGLKVDEVGIRRPRRRPRRLGAWSIARSPAGPARGNGNGASTSALTRLNMVALVPMPSARQTIASPVASGDFHNARIASRTSCSSPSIRRHYARGSLEVRRSKRPATGPATASAVVHNCTTRNGETMATPARRRPGSMRHNGRDRRGFGRSARSLGTTARPRAASRVAMRQLFVAIGRRRAARPESAAARDAQGPRPPPRRIARGAPDPGSAAHARAVGARVRRPPRRRRWWPPNRRASSPPTAPPATASAARPAGCRWRASTR